jgi:hypothetical protein
VTRPQVIDTFMVNAETDVLEMRFETMDEAVDWFVVVQADVDHQDHPKDFHFDPTADRWARWKDKIIDVRASGLPHTDHAADPWSREWAQRDWTWRGLALVPNLAPSDVVLHGDVDELCDPFFVRNVRPAPRQFVVFGQRLHCFAVDWLHPDPWGGTVACTVDTAGQIGARDVRDGVVYHPGEWQIVRNQRNGLIRPNFEHSPGGRSGWSCIPLHNAGWHFSWLGGKDAALAKLGSFCHPEIADRTAVGLTEDLFLREGFHVDGRRMIPVDVDASWPPYIYERRCPESWWRPRG